MAECWPSRTCAEWAGRGRGAGAWWPSCRGGRAMVLPASRSHRPQGRPTSGLPGVLVCRASWFVSSAESPEVADSPGASLPTQPPMRRGCHSDAREEWSSTGLRGRFLPGEARCRRPCVTPSRPPARRGLRLSGCRLAVAGACLAVGSAWLTPPAVGSSRLTPVGRPLGAVDPCGSRPGAADPPGCRPAWLARVGCRPASGGPASRVPHLTGIPRISPARSLCTPILSRSSEPCRCSGPMPQSHHILLTARFPRNRAARLTVADNKPGRPAHRRQNHVDSRHIRKAFFRCSGASRSR